MGDPFVISGDEFTNFCIKEALVARDNKEQIDAQKKQQRDEWKKDPSFAQQ